MLQVIVRRTKQPIAIHYIKKLEKVVKKKAIKINDKVTVIVRNRTDVEAFDTSKENMKDFFP